jgi:DNA invertase Pin-like site-specific DNA recombinase
MVKINETAGQQIAYRRVSSIDQNTERQLDGLKFSAEFEDKCSGKDTSRPALQAMLKHVRSGDTIHVHSMDRISRNLVDLLTLVKDLTGRGVRIQFHKENLTFTGEDSPMSNMMLQIMGAVAEFERAMIRERQREGIRIAQAKGTYRGRKAALSAAKAQELRSRASLPGANKAALAQEFGITRQTMYSYLAKPQAATERVL